MRQDVFEKRKVILGEDHPDTLSSMFSIAYSYSELGKHSNALKMRQYFFEKRKTILGKDHPDTLRSRFSDRCFVQ